MTDIKAFRRAIAVGRLPGILRRPVMWLAFNLARLRANYFGTFSVTSVSFLGADLLYVPTPTTSLLTFGVFGPDGRRRSAWSSITASWTAWQFAAILARLEAILNGPILQELRSEAGADVRPFRAAQRN